MFCADFVPACLKLRQNLFLDSFLLSLHHKGFVNYHIAEGKAALKPEAAASIFLCGDGVITCYGVIWTLLF